MDKRYWIGFNCVQGIGAVRFQALIDHFGDLRIAWEAPTEALCAAGLSRKIADRVIATRQSVDLDSLIARIERNGIRVLTWQDVDYPASLKEIDQPPPVLYLRGEYLDNDIHAVAVVGTRRLSNYGRQIAEEVAAYLAQNGITVVSGLARGVDAIAHQASLNSGGRTLAVLGSGVDRIYPPEHETLARKIIASGAVISDYPLGTAPEATNFPPRNRIISGLSLATVVIEAGETSGALITAQFALEQGRDVFAVPGSVLAPQSRGTNRLIAQGAHPVISPEDILDVLNLIHQHTQRRQPSHVPVDAIEKKILNVLSHEPLHLDEICHQAEMPVEQVSATMVMMELKGLVRQAGGNCYTLVRENP